MTDIRGSLSGWDRQGVMYGKGGRRAGMAMFLWNKRYGSG